MHQDDEQAERMVAALRELGLPVRKVTRLGGSYVLFLPPAWAKAWTTEIGGSRYVLIEARGEDGALVVKRVPPAFLDALKLSGAEEETQGHDNTDEQM